MKFSISQSELSSILGVVSKGVSSRTTLPVLTGILFKAQDNKVTLETTDTTLSVRCSAAALVEEEGQVVIPSRIIVDIVKNLPDAAVHISADEAEAQLLCDSSSFSIKAFNPQDFPSFPHVEKDTALSVPFAAFTRMVKQVAKFASTDDGHPIYTGVMIQSSGGVLRMVATDTYRLAVSEHDFDDIENFDVDFSAVIPGSFLNDAASLPSVLEDIVLGLSENQIIIEAGDPTLITRRIEGTYPNTDRLLSESTETTIEFNTKQLSDAAKRVSLMTNKVKPIKLDINVASQTTQLSTAAQDIGAAQETIGSAIQGTDCVIAFNAAFLNQGLSLVGTDTVTFEIPASKKLGVFKSESEERFTYLIIAVRIE